jgi:hypothetical protein
VPIADMVAAPKADPAPVADQPVLDSDMLPVAGAAGLGVLALAGAGIALGRRKRRKQEERDEQANYVEPVASEPSFVRPATPVAAPAVAAATIAPPSFDAPAGSSPRTVAAYKGPTEDNPSLSLKKRLKRARAMDQMERNGTLPPDLFPKTGKTGTAFVDTKVPAFRFGQPARLPAFQY